jgi:hypothetical protein
VAGELLLRVDLREEEERAFLPFLNEPLRGSGLAGIGLRCWAWLLGCCGMVSPYFSLLSYFFSFLFFSFLFSILLFQF